ncbi:hypothetical protein [Candidatus Nanohalococcus occultus]|uniref:Uncharacterized protein n=1 Tax=Candidatus Nanohalococcus occultus TaxID=2978047 RepID=A0ABY8CH04_9ARCH|nr:hypothetical protein SVXNc_0277 [Candidatus Nanohaloarchaeota archaeon SVXNc]
MSDELTARERELLECEQELEIDTSGEKEEKHDDWVSASETDFYLGISDIKGNRSQLAALEQEGLEVREIDGSILHSTFATDLDEEGYDWDFGREMYNRAVRELAQFGSRHLEDSKVFQPDVLKLSLNNDSRTCSSVLERYDDGTTGGPLDELEPSKAFLNEYWDEIKNEDLSEGSMATKSLALDLVKTLQGKALNKDNQEEYTEICRNFELFFSRANPEPDILLEDDSVYNIPPLETKEGLKLAMENTGSCLFPDPGKYGKEDPEEFYNEHPFEEAFWMWHEDSGTFHHGLCKNGEIEGYMRSFILEDSRGDYFAGIDTIEIPKSGGLNMEDVEKDFSEKSDVITAGVLGAAPHFLVNLDVDYIAGKDARIRFGPRENYGNTRKSIEYRKVGDTVPYYSVQNEHHEQDWEGAGWLDYHEKDDIEVRGFRTDPGWHRTDNAYILMENPKKLANTQ